MTEAKKFKYPEASPQSIPEGANVEQPRVPEMPLCKHCGEATNYDYKAKCWYHMLSFLQECDFKKHPYKYAEPENDKRK